MLMENTSTDSTDMKRLPMHEAVKPLAWLRGTWKTDTPGNGIYPTIKSFVYCERITFESVGQPMLNYTAKSWRPDTKAPMHLEVGVLKIMPDTNRVSLILAHNFGVATVEEGTVEDKVIKLKTTGIQRPTEGARLPAVTELQREFKLVGDCLQHKLYMATLNTELTQHLCATYVKECEDSK